MIQQKIAKYHIDKYLLNALLINNFGANGFEVDVRKVSMCYWVKNCTIV
jgi:hypothetical protein